MWDLLHEIDLQNLRDALRYPLWSASLPPNHDSTVKNELVLTERYQIPATKASRFLSRDNSPLGCLHLGHWPIDINFVWRTHGNMSPCISSWVNYELIATYPECRMFSSSDPLQCKDHFPDIGFPTMMKIRRSWIGILIPIRHHICIETKPSSHQNARILMSHSFIKSQLFALFNVFRGL